MMLSRERLPDLFEQLRDLDYFVPEAYEKGWADCLREMPLLKLQRYIGGNTFDVDVFLAELDFQEVVLSRKRRIDAEGRDIWLVSPEDLVLFKLMAGRPRDLGDVTDVLFILGSLDEIYLR